MRNYEIIKEIYYRCPKLENFTEGHRNQLSIDQLFDRCLDVVDLIELHRPEIAGKLPTENIRRLDDYRATQEFFNDTEN